MTGVAGGLAATLGLINPSNDVLMQMLGTMGVGSMIGLGIAQKIKVSTHAVKYSPPWRRSDSILQ